MQDRAYDAGTAPAADLASIIKADTHARRLREMARARLEKSRAEKLETERQLHRLDIDLRQLRARQAALEQALEDARHGETSQNHQLLPAVAKPAGEVPQSLLDHERTLLRERARALDALRQGSRELQGQLADADAVESGLRGTLALIRERAQVTRTELEHLQDDLEARRIELDRARADAAEIDTAMADTARRTASAGEAFKHETEALAALEAQTDMARRRHAEATSEHGAIEQQAVRAEAGVTSMKQRLKEAREAFALAERMLEQLASRHDEAAQVAAERQAAQAALERDRTALAAMQLAAMHAGAQRAAGQSARETIEQALREQRLAIARDTETLGALEAERQATLAHIAQSRRAGATDIELAGTIAAEAAARDSLQGDLDKVRAEAAAVADILNRETAAKARATSLAVNLQQEVLATQAETARLRVALDAATERDATLRQDLATRGEAIESLLERKRELRIAQARFEASSVQIESAAASVPAARSPASSDAATGGMEARPPAAKPRRPARALAITAAFACAAAGIYLIPRHWPPRTNAPPQAPQSTQSPADAAPESAPIYQADGGAAPALHLSRELRERAHSP